MRQIVWLLLLIVPLLFSCNSDKKKEEQQPIIPKEKFIQLLTDIHKTDGYFSSIKQNLINDTILNPKNFFGEVFHKYDVTNKDFQATILYYCYRMDEFEIIYEQVVQNLNQENDSLQMITGKKKIPEN
ncbi:MAG: DUF4296 domain-containing protein [Bacteroidales bacterium]|nr:DUF4296 domain-containing protein [Bacteroidales bacterium]